MTRTFDMYSTVSIVLLSVVFLSLSSLGASGFVDDKDLANKPSEKLFFGSHHAKHKIAQRHKAQHHNAKPPAPKPTENHRCGDGTCNPGLYVSHESACTQATHECGDEMCNAGALVCSATQCIRPAIVCGADSCNPGALACDAKLCLQKAFTCPEGTCNARERVCSRSQCQLPSETCGVNTCTPTKRVCSTDECVLNEPCPADTCGVDTCSGCTAQTPCLTGCDLGKQVCHQSECPQPQILCGTGTCNGLTLVCDQSDCRRPAPCDSFLGALGGNPLNSEPVTGCSLDDCCLAPCPMCHKRIPGTCDCEIDTSTGNMCDPCQKASSEAPSGNAICRRLTGNNNFNCCKINTGCRKNNGLDLLHEIDARTMVCSPSCGASCKRLDSQGLGPCILGGSAIGSLAEQYQDPFADVEFVPVCAPPAPPVIG